MARKMSSRKINDDYFVVFSKKFEKEKVENNLSQLGCSRDYKHIYFWPEDLLHTPVTYPQLVSCHAEIISAILTKPEKIHSILKPSKTKLKTWDKKKIPSISSDNIGKATREYSGIRYVKGSNSSSSALILKIGTLIDSKSKLRNVVNDLFKEMSNIDGGQMLQNYAELEEITGDDTQAAEEDVGDLPEDYKITEVKEKPVERAYHPPQEYLATGIVERIKCIYYHYHKKKKLEDFDSFDFRIYTVNINMLEDQTWLRLSRKESECFPDSYYEGSDIKAREEAKKKVFKYNEKTVAATRNLEDEVRGSPETLYLIIADEAHWGATSSDKPHSKLINKWNSEEHPNVILLLVTATPYNILTENSRLPTNVIYKPLDSKPFDVYPKITENKRGDCKHSDVDREITENKLRNEGYKSLHRVRWTESFEMKVKQGIIVKLKIPLQEGDGFNQLFVQTPFNECRDEGCSSRKELDLLPWEGKQSTEGEIHNSDFVIKGLDGKSNNYITLTTMDAKWTLCFRNGIVGFVRDRIPSDISSFYVITDYGERLLLLMVVEGDCEQLLTYNEDIGKIELADMDLNGEEYEVPPLSSSFLLEECRPLQSLGPVREYISLNHYVNSMRNKKTSDQLIRNDANFEKMAGNLMNKKRGATFNNLLAAEYSYYIIIINAWRSFPFSLENTRDCFKHFSECTRNFREKRKEFMHKFREELVNQRPNSVIKPIEVQIFDEILRFYADKVSGEFRDSLKHFQKMTISSEIIVKNLVHSTISCILHLDQNDLKNVTTEFNTEFSRVTDEMKQQFFSYAENIRCIDVVEEIFHSSETGQITNKLIPSDLRILNGTLNIIRTTTSALGNELYKTLCIARRISSSVNYSFEVLRDFSNAKLIDDFAYKMEENDTAFERNAKHRLRERLQVKRCTDIDQETLNSCSCNYYSNECIQLSKPSMKCKRCHHEHKRVESYEDIDGLPCILILIQKGRLGDTFPSSLSVLDLRLCNTKRTRSFILAPFVQEMGRLCRYHDKSQSKLPYALISESIVSILKEALQDGAPYYSALDLAGMKVQLDSKLVSSRNRKRNELWKSEPQKKTARPSKNHYDYNNQDKHENRILLSAEPQIGKTGVYMKVISLLQKQFSPNVDIDEEEPEEEEEVEGDEDDIDESAIPFQKKDESYYWIYPYWKDLLNAPKIAQTVNYHSSKYNRLFGTYEHKGLAPEIIPMSILNKAYKKKKNLKRSLLPSTSQSVLHKFKSLNIQEHTSCAECSFQYESDVLELSLPNTSNSQSVKTEFRISVPRILRYMKLIESVKPYIINAPKYLEYVGNSSAKFSEVKTLDSWIFIPSYNRPTKAYINLYHSMVQEKDGKCEPCLYISIIAVRSSDFETYCKLWQSTHAVLQIPDKLDGAENDALSGGIGFARRCIQVFAESVGLKWIFMLDDNIRYVYEIEESENMVKREKGMLTEKNVPLFKVLKHLETQVDGSVIHPPRNDFEKCPVSDKKNGEYPLEEYTAPSNHYGIIGIKRNSQYSRKTKEPFAKTHVYSLVFLNIDKLKSRNICYKAWGVFEDLSLNNCVDDEDLWIVKYNRFTVWKQQMKTWLPDMYIWSEETILKDVTAVAHNSSEILIKYLRSGFTFKQVKRFPCTISSEDGKESFSEHKDQEFENFLNNFTNLNGRHSMIAILSGPLNRTTENLKEFFTSSFNFHEGDNFFVLVITSQMCLESSLRKKFSIKKWLEKIVSQPFDFDVVTSHTVGSYKVKFVTIIVKVVLKSSITDTDKTSNSRSGSDKKRSSDENDENVRKRLKEGNAESSSSSVVTNDQRQETDVHKLIDEIDTETLKRNLHRVAETWTPEETIELINILARDNVD